MNPTLKNLLTVAALMVAWIVPTLVVLVFATILLLIATGCKSTTTPIATPPLPQGEVVRPVLTVQGRAQPAFVQPPPQSVLEIDLPAQFSTWTGTSLQYSNVSLYLSTNLLQWSAIGSQAVNGQPGAVYLTNPTGGPMFFRVGW